MPEIAQEWAGTGTLAFAKNLAKIIWMETLRYTGDHAQQCTSCPPAAGTNHQYLDQSPHPTTWAVHIKSKPTCCGPWKKRVPSFLFSQSFFSLCGRYRPCFYLRAGGLEEETIDYESRKAWSYYMM